jgi:hypothetical protein
MLHQVLASINREILISLIHHQNKQSYHLLGLVGDPDKPNPINNEVGKNIKVYNPEFHLFTAQLMFIICSFCQ